MTIEKIIISACHLLSRRLDRFLAVVLVTWGGGISLIAQRATDEGPLPATSRMSNETTKMARVLRARPNPEVFINNEDPHLAEDKFGISLSGGGYRAMLFEYGVLIRMNELGLLRLKAGAISSVSGGSMLSALLALHWQKFKYKDDENIVSNFQDVLDGPIRHWVSHGVSTKGTLLGMASPLLDSSDFASKSYRKLLFANSGDDPSLCDLASGDSIPTFVFNATNFQTGASIWFTKNWVWDPQFGILRHPKLPLSRVVAASAAFPPFLGVMTITRKELAGEDQKWERVYVRSEDGYSVTDEEEKQIEKKIEISDGGVFDNLGIDYLIPRFRKMVVIDSGKPTQTEKWAKTDWISQLRRTLDIASGQSDESRKRLILLLDQIHFQSEGMNSNEELRKLGREVYLVEIKPRGIVDDQVPPSLKEFYSQIKKESEPRGQDAPKESKLAKSKKVRPDAVSTTLSSFPSWLQHRLINWGYTIGAIELRRYESRFANNPQLKFPTPKLPFPMN